MEISDIKKIELICDKIPPVAGWSYIMNILSYSIVQCNNSKKDYITKDYIYEFIDFLRSENFQLHWDDELSNKDPLDRLYIVKDESLLKLIKLAGNFIAKAEVYN